MFNPGSDSEESEDEDGLEIFYQDVQYKDREAQDQQNQGEKHHGPARLVGGRHGRRAKCARSVMPPVMMSYLMSEKEQKRRKGKAVRTRISHESSDG